MALVLAICLTFGTDGVQERVGGEEARALLPAPSEWILVRGQLGGEWFDGGRLRLDRGGRGELEFGGCFRFQLKYYLAPSARDSRIDLSLLDQSEPALEGRPEWETRPSIYRIDSDRLILCIHFGKERPTDFITKPNDGRVLLIFARKRD
jgi:hypothetical protein